MLNLNDTQEGVLSAVFRIADDQGLLLIDFKDLKAMLTYVSENAAELKMSMAISLLPVLVRYNAICLR